MAGLFLSGLTKPEIFSKPPMTSPNSLLKPGVFLKTTNFALTPLGLLKNRGDSPIELNTRNWKPEGAKRPSAGLRVWQARQKIAEWELGHISREHGDNYKVGALIGVPFLLKGDHIRTAQSGRFRLQRLVRGVRAVLSQYLE